MRRAGPCLLRPFRPKEAVTMNRNFMVSMLTLTALLASGKVAQAVTTRVWVSTTFQDFSSGEGQGVLVTSAGRLERGETTRRVEVGKVAMVFAMIEVGNALYLGTGTEGEIWRYQGGKTAKVTSLPGAVLVTSFARGPGSTIYVGSLPEGKVYALDTATGQAKVFSTLPAEHIWALHYDAGNRTLFAATGPKGQLFAVDTGGRAKVHWDSGEKHLLSMTRGPGGALYVGSAPKAIVYRILGPGRAMALHDFAGNEVRALVGNDKLLYAAVNEIKPDQSTDVRYPTKTPRKGTAIKTQGSGQEDTQLPRLGAKKGKGGVFRLDAEGAASQVYGVAAGYFTSLELGPEGRVYAGEGIKGQVVTILPDRATAIANHVKERQVLSFAMSGNTRAFGTGDAGALHVIGPGGDPPTYLSAAYDTGTSSRFGLMAIRASGAITLEARSGNTAEPDKGWSPWQATVPRGRPTGGIYRAALRSPSARYVQYRLRWPGGSRAVVQEVRLHFTPSNQAPIIEEFTVGTIGSGKTPVQKASWLTSQTTAAPTERRIAWKVTDPDGDALVYRVWFRAVGDPAWRRVGTEPILTSAFVQWKTDNLPDGWYEVRLEASDEGSSGAGRVRKVERISPPVLVDHGKPDIVGLRVAYPVVTGLAQDRFSRITGVAWSLDGKLWRQVDPMDGVWDEEAERFEFRITPPLKPGSYTLLVRAYDEAGNARIVRQPLTVR